MDADERRSLLLAFIGVYLRFQSAHISLTLLASLAVAFLDFAVLQAGTGKP